MRGFDDKALILFPFYDNWQSRHATYKYQCQQAVNHLCGYLRSVDIVPHVFYSDDVARKINHPDFVWVATMGRADSFFASRNCDGMQDALSRPTVMFDELYNEILAKDPATQDMSVEERFEMVVRHVNKAVAKIIPSYKIVIHFRFKNRMQYKVASKAGDSKIRINVDANTFLPTCYMGGIEMNACELLDIPYGNRSLDVWES